MLLASIAMLFALIAILTPKVVTKCAPFSGVHRGLW